MIVFGKRRLKRRRLERRWRMSGEDEDRKQYCRQRQLLHRLGDQAKIEYYSRIVNEAEVDQKRLFGIIKNLFQHQREPILPSHEGHQELAKRFAVFFQKKN